MTKTSEDVKGIRTNNERPQVIPMETDMENKHLSKADFVAKYDAQKKADEAGKAARQKVLDEAKAAKKGATQKPVDPNEEKINKLRAELADVEKELKDDPTSKKLLKQKNKIAGELDKAEDGE